MVEILTFVCTPPCLFTILRSINYLVVLAIQKSGFTKLQQYILVRDKFIRGWKNAQHRFSTCFVVMLPDNLEDFVARISEIKTAINTTSEAQRDTFYS